MGRQSGQALLYGIFMLVAGLAALFFMFNVGQLTREKTKLVTTADAVAYSAGLMHARALNYSAYNNRALLANEVLISQMVSMSSWAQYVENWSGNLPRVHPECRGIAQVENGNYWSAFFSMLAAMRKFGPEYAVACGLMESQYIRPRIPNFSNLVQNATAEAVAVAEVQKSVIKTAQQILHTGFVAERHRIMQSVADANYAGDGHVTVDLTAGTDDWLYGPGGAFTKRYDGSERTRFKDVTLEGAYTDAFVKERRWRSTAVIPQLGRCFGKFNYVDRAGGTALLGLDEWHAVDTQSYHRYRARRFIGCRKGETPTGMAQQEASVTNQAPAGTYGGSSSRNPSAHRYALQTNPPDMRYSGLPGYYDLNASWLTGSNSNKEPVLRHSVRLTRAANQLRTTDGSTGQIQTRGDSRIAAYETTLADGVMAAVSGTEVFFERPPDHGDNRWGAKRSRPVELGSLFNPYWQTRLVEGDVASQWLRQGVARP